MKLQYAIVVPLLAVAGICQAQVQVGSPGYDAWKLSQVQHPAQPHHPAPATIASTRDGDPPCACWIEPDSTYTLALAPNDDGSSGLIALPFQFSLYGDLYSACYVNNNGNVSFQDPYGTYSASGFPTSDFKMLAPFWGDVDTRVDSAGNGGTVMYKLTPHALYVNWSSVGYYAMHDDRVNSFQLIISDGNDPVIPGGNNVSFCYGGMQWTTGDASEGVGGLGGIPATVGANKGDGIDYLQLGRFDHDSTDWDGPFDNSDGVQWLTERHFAFSTADADIPPIFTSTGCDTLYVEAGTSLIYPMLMIAGGPGQLVSGTSSCPGIASYSEMDNTSGEVAQIVSSMTPTEDEVGLYSITYTAQNDASTPLTSNYTVIVDVMPGTTTGVAATEAPQRITVQPNPAGDRAILSWPADQRPALVQLIAMDGSVALTSSPGSGSQRVGLDIGGLAAGVYTVLATGPSGVSATRLIHVADR